MLHNLDQITAKELWPGLHFKFVHTQNMTFSFVKIVKGAELAEHAHMNEQVSIIKKGILLLNMEGTEFKLKDGDVLVIPSNKRHSAVALDDCEVIDVFYPVREDYKG